MKFIKHWFDVIFLLVVISLLFWGVIVNIPSDIPHHIDFCSKINSGFNSYPSNFLYYLLANLFTFFSGDLSYLTRATFFILCSASIAKYIITKNYLFKNIPTGNKQQKKYLSVLTAFFLFFSFSIVDPLSYIGYELMYIGRFVSNAWHNTTLILLFPFSILVFWLQVEVFDDFPNFSYRNIYVLTALIFINAFIKPSFILVYIPVTIFFLIRKNLRFKSKIIYPLYYPIFAGVFLLSIQYLYTYYFQIGSMNTSPSGVEISYPFHALLYYIPIWMIPISFLFSFLFPISLYLIYPEVKEDSHFRYSVNLIIFSLLISTFFIETGPRLYHLNFYWQNIICCYLLFLSSSIFLIKKILLHKLNFKNKLLSIIFILHSISGILYLFKVFSIKSFM